MKAKSKRVVAIADLHCGHRVGMTPPAWQLNPDNESDAKWHALQVAQWDWYVKTIRSLRPIHLLLVLGDCVDGRGERADGRDVIRRKRKEQVDMAEKVILEAKAENIEMVFGTRYHVADWEEDLCAQLGSKAHIGAHQWAEVACEDGPSVVFDIKHYVGGSTIPHGRSTAPSREEVWNLIWAEAERQPRGDVFLRGHVHYFEPKKQRGRWIMTCPALQGVGTEFGAERCSGTVDFGLIAFDVFPDGRLGWQEHLVVLPTQKATTAKY